MGNYGFAGQGANPNLPVMRKQSREIKTENSKLSIKTDHSAGQNNAKQPSERVLHGDCFIKDRDQSLLKTI